MHVVCTMLISIVKIIHVFSILKTTDLQRIGAEVIPKIAKFNLLSANQGLSKCFGAKHIEMKSDKSCRGRSTLTCCDVRRKIALKAKMRNAASKGDVNVFGYQSRRKFILICLNSKVTWWDNKRETLQKSKKRTSLSKSRIAVIADMNVADMC